MRRFNVDDKVKHPIYGECVVKELHLGLGYVYIGFKGTGVWCSNNELTATPEEIGAVGDTSRAWLRVHVKVLKFSLDNRVEHGKYGIGTVIEVDESDTAIYQYHVQFDMGHKDWMHETTLTRLLIQPATSTLIPFDLDKAKAGGKVVRRDGAPILQFGHFEIDVDAFPVVASDGKMKTSHTIKGKLDNSDEESDLDLFMQPEMKSFFKNIWLDGLGNAEYHSLEDAKKFNCDQPAIAVLAFTTTEGKTVVTVAHTY